MALGVYFIVVDAVDSERLAAFWSAALDWPVAFSDPGEVAIEPPDDAGPAMLFIQAAEPKAGKNRLHLDLSCDDQDAEVRRLEGLGARRIDIGQGATSWVVMADPEGNEFCVLAPEEAR